MLCVWQGMVHPTDAWVSSQSSVHTAWCAKSSGLEALADDGARWMGRCWGAEPRCLGGECDVWLVPLPPQTTCQSAWMQRSLSLDPAFPPRSRASLCAPPPRLLCPLTFLALIHTDPFPPCSAHFTLLPWSSSLLIFKSQFRKKKGN